MEYKQIKILTQITYFTSIFNSGMSSGMFIKGNKNLFLDYFWYDTPHNSFYRQTFHIWAIVRCTISCKHTLHNTSGCLLWKIFALQPLLHWQLPLLRQAAVAQVDRQNFSCDWYPSFSGYFWW